MKIPLAEHFHSLQGEGHFVGTPMHFIRLAGCSVGKLTNETSAPFLTNSPLAAALKTPARAWQCKTWDSRPFWCDTDFSKYAEVDLDDLMAETYEQHLCLTGGEPLVHKMVVDEVFHRCLRKKILLHIETSGTIFRQPSGGEWISVSPKLHCLASMFEAADEIKLLVDTGFDPTTIPFILQRRDNVFLQPINHETKVDPVSLAKVFELLRQFPQWRLSVQQHKLLDIR